MAPDGNGTTRNPHPRADPEETAVAIDAAQTRAESLRRNECLTVRVSGEIA
jgi:hypothetical protein